MLNPIQIEEAYKEFMTNMADCAHDGIIHIDLHFLHETGLLKGLAEDKSEPDDLSQYFHVIESVEKVTLFNEQFIVWIIPKTRGIYNTPRYVLKVLQHYLVDMLETEATLISIEKSQ